MADIMKMPFGKHEGEDYDVIPLDAVHGWFELTYAQYLTVPRSLLETMPQEWQRRFVQCLQELDQTFDWRPKSGRYWVALKDGQGKMRADPFREYRHPDRLAINQARRLP
jgi:hypothetical protein